jgi:hypothetical protein
MMPVQVSRRERSAVARLFAWNARQGETQRRAAAGLPPKTANGAARPSPASPPDHPDRNLQDHDHEPRTRH